MPYHRLKGLCSDLNIQVRLDEPLARHTSLKVGGPADIAMFPEAPILPVLMRALDKEQIPVVILGRGTNVVVSDRGIEGAVIFTDAMASIKAGDKDSTLEVEPGVALSGLIRRCLQAGLTGIEGLVGIPGSVGGAIAGNAGSFGYEIRDVLTEMRLLSADGQLTTVPAAAIKFSYRRADLPAGKFIVAARIMLSQDDPIAVRKRVVAYMREKMAHQPLLSPSAGCVFTNPPGTSAGRLIDESGCKGLKAGGIEVSRVHANYFVNTGGGTAVDFLRLMDMVMAAVRDRFRVALEPEVKIIGRA